MSSTDEKLIRMVNQIAGFFKTQPGDKAANSTAQHLREFWDPAMIRQLGDLLNADAAGMDPVARSAATQVVGRSS